MASTCAPLEIRFPSGRTAPQYLNVWPAAQGLVANTIQYLASYDVPQDAAPEDSKGAASAAATAQDYAVRTFQLGKWMAYFLTVAWEDLMDHATSFILAPLSLVCPRSAQRS